MKETYNTGWRVCGDTEFLVSLVVLVEQIYNHIQNFKTQNSSTNKNLK